MTEFNSRVQKLLPSAKTQHIWDKVFKNGPSKICGRQPLKTFIILEYSWILCLIYSDQFSALSDNQQPFLLVTSTAQKMKYFIKDFFSKSD